MCCFQQLRVQQLQTSFDFFSISGVLILTVVKYRTCFSIFPPQDTCSSVLFFKVSFLSHKKTKVAEDGLNNIFKEIPLTTNVFFLKKCHFQYTLKDSLL